MPLSKRKSTNEFTERDTRKTDAAGLRSLRDGSCCARTSARDSDNEAAASHNEKHRNECTVDVEVRNSARYSRCKMLRPRRPLQFHRKVRRNSREADFDASLFGNHRSGRRVCGAAGPDPGGGVALTGPDGHQIIGHTL